MKNFGLHLDSRFCSFVIYYVYYVGYHFFDTSSQTFSKRILKKNGLNQYNAKNLEKSGNTKPKNRNGVKEIDVAEFVFLFWQSGLIEYGPRHAELAITWATNDCS